MNTLLKTKYWLAVPFLLTGLVAFQAQHYIGLQNTLGLAPQECEQRASALLDGRDATGTQQQTITLRTLAPKQQPQSNKPLPKPQQPTSANLSTETEKPKLERFNESLEDIVNRKYRFLLSKLDLSPAEKEHLIQLLIQRERVALNLRDAELFSEELDVDPTSVADLRYELEMLDEAIADILDSSGNSERYAMLKDSEQEQKEFNQYTLGVTGLFPLENTQQETVLMARLKHKQSFEAALTEAGFHGDYPLNEEQQKSLLQQLEKAAYQYQIRFLDDVRPHLDNSNFPMDQYTMLENYTKTEFKELIAQLRENVEERGVY